MSSRPPGLADRPQMRADGEGCLGPSASARICLGLPSGPTPGRRSGGSSRGPGRDRLVLKTHKQPETETVVRYSLLYFQQEKTF